MDIAEVKEVIDQSNKLVSWCLCLTGGSVATLLGSIYVRPVGKKMRLSYFLFLLGWIFLGVAFKYGSDLSSETLSATVEQHGESKYIDIFSQIRSDYSSQLSHFNLALYTFGAWLFIYLLWWIFSGSNSKKA